MDLPLVPLAMIGASVVLLGVGGTFGLLRGKKIWGNDKDKDKSG